MLCAGVVAVLLGVSGVLAQPLYDQDGIRAHGTVRRVTANAATCHVLEASHSAEMYQRMKANEGKPLHLWAVDLSVVNESGRWLESLRANFNQAAGALASPATTRRSKVAKVSPTLFG